jgi:hypothetical protein
MNLPSVNASLLLMSSYAGSHRDEVQKFVDSLVQANARIKADKATSVSIEKKYFKSEDTHLMELVYDYYLPLTPVLPFPRAELFGPAVEQLAKQNPKVKDVDVDKAIDPSFVKSAADRGLDKA